MLSTAACSNARALRSRAVVYGGQEVLRLTAMGQHRCLVGLQQDHVSIGLEGSCLGSAPSCHGP
jgi:hypothetical protein